MKIFRNVFVLLLLVGLGLWYLGYLTPEPKPVRRLAPPGTVYLLQYVSVPRPGGGGLIGFTPGVPFRVVENRGPDVVVSDGTYQAQVPRTATTDDLDVAENVGRADAETQRRLTAERLRVEREQAIARRLEQEKQTRAREELERRRREQPALPSPLAPPR